MHIYIGADHGGIAAKDALTLFLRALGHEVTDVGPHQAVPTDDYPPFARAVGEGVRDTHGSCGILLCRSGEGMEMAVNKIRGIRGALVWKEEVAVETRRDNDANVLVLPADFLNSTEIEAIAKAFLDTPFSGEERHQRRINQLHQLEDL
jgi:ribose 5-phosphate isomerase B